jgi:hypothetical protein
METREGLCGVLVNIRNETRWVRLFWNSIKDARMGGFSTDSRLAPLPGQLPDRGEPRLRSRRYDGGSPAGGAPVPFRNCAVHGFHPGRFCTALFTYGGDLVVLHSLDVYDNGDFARPGG